jgi:hypothetical protein
MSETTLEIIGRLRMGGIWRHPAEESTSLYPGFVVCDDRITGAITAGSSRLPLYVLPARLIYGGFNEIEEDFGPDLHGMTADSLCGFLVDLLEMRGEFARLLLVLADNERRERQRPFSDKAWWQRKSARRRVITQLRHCIAVLENEADVRSKSGVKPRKSR